MIIGNAAHNFKRRHPKDDYGLVWFQYVKQFQRRRFLKKLTTDVENRQKLPFQEQKLKNQLPDFSKSFTAYRSCPAIIFVIHIFNLALIVSKIIVQNYENRQKFVIQEK